ncbi:VOC family protein [Streptomyces flaveolus]|jgi:hypothetical protein|uniref:hypothetical protein n=1 Tax=Streptomyces flaveolus TaxID=67297 RepID=UPI001670139A|nr:hypothetical protein [Streptomyces flaveolus]GGQ80674.1 hypothetical protein GCM10010216_48050 [Streptomyces flaveolus]
MTSRFTELAVDCHDPERLASFWCEALDFERSWVVMSDPEGNEFCVLRTLAPRSQGAPGAA